MSSVYTFGVRTGQASAMIDITSKVQDIMRTVVLRMEFVSFLFLILRQQ